VAGSAPGSTSSPRPVPRAVPPTSANGTSLPSSAASASRSSSVVSNPQSRSSATNAAAASAEPPAIPPATGIDLITDTEACTSTPWWSASSRAARSTMLAPVTGTASGSIQSGTVTPRVQPGDSAAVTSSHSPTAW